MVATPGSSDRHGWCCLAERSAEDQEAIEVTARKKDLQNFGGEDVQLLMEVRPSQVATGCPRVELALGVLWPRNKMQMDTIGLRSSPAETCLLPGPGEEHASAPR